MTFKITNSSRLLCLRRQAYYRPAPCAIWPYIPTLSNTAPRCSLPPAQEAREKILAEYRKKVLEHRETEAKVKKLRLGVRDLVKEYDKTEGDLAALQSVGNIIGEVLKDLGNDKFIVKASSGPRYVVGVRSRLDQSLLKNGTRVALDMTTLTIMRLLPREVDPTVFQMQSEEEGKVSFSDIGGLTEQIRELREVIELPLTNPEVSVACVSMSILVGDFSCSDLAHPPLHSSSGASA